MEKLIVLLMMESVHIGIQNNNTGYVEINGGKIYCDGHSVWSGTNGILNNNTGIIKMNSGEIICYSGYERSYGVRTRSSSKAEIKGGKIKCTSGRSGATGVLSDSSSAIITIGTKGDGIVSTEIPTIEAINMGTSTSYTGIGISNPYGTFNFYDGKIKGSTRAVNAGHVITEIEDNTTQNWQENDTVLTLSTDPIDIAKIGNTTYSSLQDAINASGNNQTTIELLRGIYYTNSDSTVTVANGQNITLDLKGFTISSAIEGPVFSNSGGFKITDSTQDENGKVFSTNSNVIQNNSRGTLELNKGTITKLVSTDYVVYNQGTTNVTGAKVLQPSNDGYPIYNTTNAILNINSGEVTGGEKSVYSLGTTTISGGTIERISNETSATLTINNGTLSGPITNTGTSSILMTGGTLTGDIIGRNNDSNKYGIFNTSTGAVTVTGGTITTNIDSTYYNAYAIHSTAGTINIGTKDSNIITTPVLLGDTNAIYSSGTSTFNYYDGTLKEKVLQHLVNLILLKMIVN